MTHFKTGVNGEGEHFVTRLDETSYTVHGPEGAGAAEGVHNMQDAAEVAQ